MKFIFLLIALFTFVFSSAFDENYGCELKGKNKCCWVNFNSCCKPAEGVRTCREAKTLCCKLKEYNLNEGEYVYIYKGGSDSD